MKATRPKTIIIVRVGVNKTQVTRTLRKATADIVITIMIMTMITMARTRTIAGIIPIIIQDTIGLRLLSQLRTAIRTTIIIMATMIRGFAERRMLFIRGPGTIIRSMVTIITIPIRIATEHFLLVGEMLVG